MSRPRSLGLKRVARTVALALEQAGIRAVLTGGACASFYSGGIYQSSDLDFVLVTSVKEAQLIGAMASIGFHPRSGHFVHADLPFFVEFPRGPLAIGRDIRVEPVRYVVRGAGIPALSATDSCRDRLAAFYHWGDRSSLKAAIAIARRNRVNLRLIERWSDGEGASPGFEEFVRQVTPRRRRRASDRTD